jgi:uncharacterized damage-inducible protein DinB
MAPADLLQPLEGQREQTLRVLESLAPEDLDVEVGRGGRTVHQVLCHLVDREHAVNFIISRALAGDVVRMSQEDRDEMARSESDPAPADWDLTRIVAELGQARESLRRTFKGMSEADLDLPIRWHEWSARTIRTTIPYMLEHEDSHIDELRAAIGRDRRSSSQAS